MEWPSGTRIFDDIGNSYYYTRLGATGRGSDSVKNRNAEIENDETPDRPVESL